MTRIGRTLLAIACSAAALAQAQAAQRVSIAGTVHDPDGAVVPGVEIRATIGNRSRVTRSNSDGRYQFTRLAAGTYTLVPKLAGFCTDSKTVSVTGARVPIASDFWLELAPVQQVAHVIRPVEEAFELADAVARIRVTRSYAPRRRPNADCGVVSTEHEVEIMEAVKSGHERWPNAPRVRLLQPRAGELPTDGGRRERGQYRPVEVGEEFVAFVSWSDYWGAFIVLETLLFDIHDGSVSARMREPQDFQDGTSLGSFMARLRDYR